MREGYGSHSVCPSVTALAFTYLIYTLKTRYHIRLLVAILTNELCGFLKNTLFKSYGDTF